MACNLIYSLIKQNCGSHENYMQHVINHFAKSERKKERCGIRWRGGKQLIAFGVNTMINHISIIRITWEIVRRYSIKQYCTRYWILTVVFLSFSVLPLFFIFIFAFFSLVLPSLLSFSLCFYPICAHFPSLLLYFSFIFLLFALAVKPARLLYILSEIQFTFSSLSGIVAVLGFYFAQFAQYMNNFYAFHI